MKIGSKRASVRETQYYPLDLTLSAGSLCSQIKKIVKISAIIEYPSAFYNGGIMSSAVSRPPAADAASALKHFESLLEFETDCWDVHHAITNNRMDFVLRDVRGEEAFARGHIKGAVRLPHARINEDALQAYPPDTLFVVYCAGPHCNGADKAAIRLANLGGL